MPTPIKVKVGDLILRAELSDSATAQQVLKLCHWRLRPPPGDEIYFGIPVNAELEESAQDAVDLGDLAYWPPGSALCIFYGRTPVSTSSEIRPASPVNIIGRLLDDWSGLKGTASGTTVRVELA